MHVLNLSTHVFRHFCCALSFLHFFFPGIFFSQFFHRSPGCLLLPFYLAVGVFILCLPNNLHHKYVSVSHKYLRFISIRIIVTLSKTIFRKTD